MIRRERGQRRGGGVFILCWASLTFDLSFADACKNQLQLALQRNTPTSGSSWLASLRRQLARTWVRWADRDPVPRTSTPEL